MKHSHTHMLCMENYFYPSFSHIILFVLYKYTFWDLITMWKWFSGDSIFTSEVKIHTFFHTVLPSNDYNWCCLAVYLKPPIIDRHVFWGFYDTTSSIYICRPFRYAYMWYECQQSSSRSLWSLWKYIFLSSFICTLFVQSLLLKSVFESCICSCFYWLYNQSHHLWKFLKSVFKTCVSCVQSHCLQKLGNGWGPSSSPADSSSGTGGEFSLPCPCSSYCY